MSNYQLDFVEYTEEFLELSWVWLNDPEIKDLTMTPSFTKNDQINFFKKLSSRSDYKIYGITVNGEKSGACGIKNIENGKAEFWCYFGLKKYWGCGLGSTVVKYVEAECEKYEVNALYLKVSKSNLRAIKAYEKNGFIIQSYYFEYLVMGKPLYHPKH